MLHFVITTGPLFISACIALTPQGRSVIENGWDWLKGLFSKKGASSGWRFAMRFRRTSRKGDEAEFDISCQRDATPRTAFNCPRCDELFKKYPAAVGCEHLNIPGLPKADCPALLPPLQFDADATLNRNEIEQKTTENKTAYRKRFLRGTTRRRRKRVSRACKKRTIR
jgi:hypothetical protein